MQTSKTISSRKMTRLALVLMLISVINGCAVATVVAITAGATMVADRRTFSRQIDDQSIEFIALSRLSEQQALSNNTNLHVVSMNGTVLIVGQAPNSYLRDLAFKTIEDIPDIVITHNQVRIEANISITTKTNDAWLTSRVKAELLANEKISAANIKVVTENSEVFLLGIVTNEEANIAVEITRNIKGVSRVFKAFEYI
ncbi:MAG: BON domain-containing protein [Colwellia sp.]